MSDRLVYAKQGRDEAFTREELLRYRASDSGRPSGDRGSGPAVPKRASFTELAACRGLGTDLWFPEKNQPYKSKAAREICRGCPVRGQCLDYAESFTGRQKLAGTWGGLSQKQRSHRRNAA